ncbi:MAG TPA: GvpL/GvpF family gas vesicle protein [Vicinamibacterales bacterium]
MNSTLTYVYCLVRSTRRPALRAVPAGLSGSRDLRLLAAGAGVWLVVSSVPERRYGEAALQRGLQNLDWVGRRAMEHEAVVEHFLAALAVLPMQLFTLFTSDERAVSHVTRDKRRIGRILARIERQVEWGLRLAWDEQAVRGRVERAHDRPATGAAFLARKRDLLDVKRVHLTEARAAADRLYRALSREATAALRRTATEQAAPGSRLLLDAAFLVPTRKAGAFRAALRRSTKTLGRSGLVVSLTGPWPPYNFI